MLGTGCNSVFGIHDGKPRPICADGSMIDDMEDGDGAICHTDGRTGGWYDFGDGTLGNLTPKSDGRFTPTLIEDGSRGTSRYAARFAGSGFTAFGAIMGFDLRYPKAAYDASSRGAGITFWMKSNVPVSVDFPTSETSPVQNGGQCVDGVTPGGCNQHFSFRITAPAPGWFAYQVPFNALSGGGLAIWNPQHLLGVNFRVPQGTTFEVWVDDIAFYQCAGPECQPTCTDPNFQVSCRIGNGLRSSCRPPGTDCAAVDTWCSDPLLIDDMEDGDDAICASGGRHGGWSSQSDGSSTKLIPATDAVFTQTLIPGGRGASRYAARLTGSGFAGYALMGFELNYLATGEADYDGSKFDGITFSMKSDVPVTVGFTSPQTLPVKQGGTCDLTAAQENCRRHFEFAMGATGNEWLDYKVPFSALRQAANRATPFTSIAASATWDSSRLRSIAFLTSSPDFDIWIDDIRFYTCSPDACLPTCTGDTPVPCAASGGRPSGCWPTGTDCASPPDLVNTGIWGTGPNDVWLVGQSTISWAGTLSHWDGASWTQTESGPLPPIWGVWGNGTNDVWAVPQFHSRGATRTLGVRRQRAGRSVCLHQQGPGPSALR
jgi:hypothetical protein